MTQASLFIEEISHREQFFKAEGAYLPEDLCPYVGDMPVMLEVAASSDEVSVAIDSEYVAEVRLIASYLAGKLTLLQVQRYITRGQSKHLPETR